MIPTITHTRFERYRQTYRRTLDKVPTQCTLVIHSVIPDTGFTAFTGDSGRSTQSFTLKCLYKRQFAPNERTKFGLHEEATGIVWISPIHLKHLTGSEKIEKKKTHIIIAGEEYMADKVVYKEPLYDSCIAIEIHLVDYEDE